MIGVFRVDRRLIFCKLILPDYPVDNSCFYQTNYQPFSGNGILDRSSAADRNQLIAEITESESFKFFVIGIAVILQKLNSDLFAQKYRFRVIRTPVNTGDISGDRNIRCQLIQLVGNRYTQSFVGYYKARDSDRRHYGSTKGANLVYNCSLSNHAFRIVTAAPASVACPAPYDGCIGEPSGNACGRNIEP